jgi:hypothetical protein
MKTPFVVIPSTFEAQEFDNKTTMIMGHLYDSLGQQLLGKAKFNGLQKGRIYTFQVVNLTTDVKPGTEKEIGLNYINGKVAQYEWTLEYVPQAGDRDVVLMAGAMAGIAKFSEGEKSPITYIGVYRFISQTPILLKGKIQKEVILTVTEHSDGTYVCATFGNNK